MGVVTRVKGRTRHVKGKVGMKREVSIRVYDA